MNTPPTNAERIARGRATLTPYRTTISGSDPAECVTDMLADVLHYLNSLGLEIDEQDCARLARMHFGFERDEAATNTEKN